MRVGDFAFAGEFLVGYFEFGYAREFEAPPLGDASAEGATGGLEAEQLPLLVGDSEDVGFAGAFESFVGEGDDVFISEGGEDELIHLCLFDAAVCSLALFG